ncbi:MAG: DUF262 domain-containing protein [Acidobacteriota bacterium]|nr:DUF262 domain-containing protein [Acidobacteriota bacterium]
MKRVATTWTVEDLVNLFPQINFPDYQREANIWSLGAKQRLIDSMMRQFDIASLYFYRSRHGEIDCIDGRQRIGAIMSFLDRNPGDPADGAFRFRISNEIQEDDPTSPFSSLHRCTIDEIRERETDGDEAAALFLERLLAYRIAVVELSDSQEEGEFNLQFTRLNLGKIINSGEKLNAMVGALRDVCFEDLGKHPFLEAAGIPTRRFSRPQLAAQIVAQVFALESSAGDEGRILARTRHLDLQRLFKVHANRLSSEEERWIGILRNVLDQLHESFGEAVVLGNRAIVVSTVMLAYEHAIRTSDAAARYYRFMEEFLGRLKWQVAKGLDADYGYRYLLEFQRHVTQASVERGAVEKRAELLEREYLHWCNHGTMTNDAEFRRDTGTNPSEVWRRALT